MSKTFYCLKMIEILENVNFITARELASILDINKRNVIEYVKELEECGYNIESSVGVNGGYHLNKSNINEENLALNVDSIIINAINNYNKLEIVYIGLNDNDVCYIFHPYKILKLKDNLILYGFNETKNDFSYLRFDSILDSKQMYEHFTKKKI